MTSLSFSEFEHGRSVFKVSDFIKKKICFPFVECRFREILSMIASYFCSTSFTCSIDSSPPNHSSCTTRSTSGSMRSCHSNKVA